VAATSAELARLGRLLLGDGAIDGRRVVSAAAIARMISDLAPGGQDIDFWGDSPGAETSRYGLGVNVETIDGRTCLTHGGGTVGYASFLLADRDAGLAVAVVTNGNGDHPAAQVLARVAHALFRAALAVDDLPTLPDPRSAVVPKGWAQEGSGQGWTRSSRVLNSTGNLEPAEMLGHFAGRAPDGALVAFDFARDPADGALTITHQGVTARLHRTWNSGLVCDHPALRRFASRYADGPSGVGDWEGPHWRWGPVTLLPEGPQPKAAQLPQGAGGPASGPDCGSAEGAVTFDGAAAGAAGAATGAGSRLDVYVGHYRSYSPWYPHLRIVRREDQLLLIAPGGVEAPGEEEDLVEVSPGVFRIGADPWLPERLVAGPIVDGHMVSLDRDGCRYSRAFTD
jgi:hypothetical protein